MLHQNFEISKHKSFFKKTVTIILSYTHFYYYGVIDNCRYNSRTIYHTPIRMSALKVHQLCNIAWTLRKQERKSQEDSP